MKLLFFWTSTSETANCVRGVRCCFRGGELKVSIVQSWSSDFQVVKSSLYLWNSCQRPYEGKDVSMIYLCILPHSPRVLNKFIYYGILNLWFPLGGGTFLRYRNPVGLTITNPNTDPAAAPNGPCRFCNLFAVWLALAAIFALKQPASWLYKGRGLAILIHSKVDDMHITLMDKTLISNSCIFACLSWKWFAPNGGALFQLVVVQTTESPIIAHSSDRPQVG